MWANRNSGDFLSKSGEVKFAGAMKGDNSESRRESGGAGLGLMSMAKRCVGPIEYELTEQNDSLFLFTLTATVKS